jgi:hypothetical protein
MAKEKVGYFKRGGFSYRVYKCKATKKLFINPKKVQTWLTQEECDLVMPEVKPLLGSEPILPFLNRSIMHQSQRYDYIQTKYYIEGAEGVHTYPDQFARALENIVNISRNYPPNDRIQFIFMCDGMDHPISTKCIRVGDLTLDMLGEKIAQCMEYGKLAFCDGTNSVITVQYKREEPHSGVKKFYLAEEEAFKGIRNIVQIKNPDNLCFYYALAVVLECQRPDITNMEKARICRTGSKVQSAKMFDLRLRARVEPSSNGMDPDQIRQVAINLEIRICVFRWMKPMAQEDPLGATPQQRLSQFSVAATYNWFTSEQALSTQKTLPIIYL